MAAASIFLYFQKRSSHIDLVRNTHPGREYRAPRALSINPRYGLFQLDSNEAVAELSANLKKLLNIRTVHLMKDAILSDREFLYIYRERKKAVQTRFATSYAYLK